MTGMIGCAGLIGIAVFIVLLALWSRKSRQGVQQFYEKYSLALANDGPSKVREMIGSPNTVCRSGAVKLAFGNEVRLHWWEWFTSSMTTTGSTHTTTIECFLAISFAPNSVGEDFKRKANAECENGKSFSVKRALSYDTSIPYRVESLDDGTFIIFWRVLQRPQVMEQKIAWLKENLTAGSPASAGTGNFVVVQAEVDLALMMMQNDGDFVPSGVQTYNYYFLAPRSFVSELYENTTNELAKIYSEHRAAMSQKEPNDPNYISVVGLRPKVMSSVECADQPWLTARVPGWEESVCIALRDGGVYKLSPHFFTGAIGAAK